jgi:hypothetical protein
MTFNVRQSSNNFFVRYYNNTAYIFYGDIPIVPVPSSCYPIAYYSSWIDPNSSLCASKVFSSPGETTYYKWPQANIPPQAALDILNGSPPTFNISKKIKITIPYDPIFSGFYTFDRDFYGNWIFNSGESNTLLTPYYDSSSSFNESYLVKLNNVGSSFSPRYQGYFEWQTDNSVAKSGFAFPCYLVFTALKPPSGIIDGLKSSFDAASFSGSLPAITGRECHRFVAGIKLPIRYRHVNGDWILVDQISHNISGITNYVSGIESQPSNFNINLINNNPYDAEYGTAQPSGTGINQNGFAFRVTASGFGFDGGSYPSDPNIFLSNHQKYQTANYYWYDSNNSNAFMTTVVDQTKFSNPKIPSVASITFVESCRNPNGSDICNQQIVPTSIVPSVKQTGCLGSTINIDYWCGENLSKPDINNFITNNITSITPVYSGVTNIYPLTKLSDSTSNFFSTTNNIITLPYTGSYNPNVFREWINEEIKFVSLNGSEIYKTYDNIDIYWQTNQNDTTNIYAKLFPDDGERPPSDGIYLYFAESQLNGFYRFDNGDWVFISDSNIRMRFIGNKWLVGIISGATFNAYYELSNYPDTIYTRYNDEVIYYGFQNGQGNKLSLNIDAHPTCNSGPSTPEILTVNPYVMQSGNSVVLKVWRNLFSDCNSASGTAVTNQTVTISCISGSIIVDNQILTPGNSKIYSTIQFVNARGIVDDYASSISGTNILAIQNNSVFLASGILDWNTQRDHDLYGQLMYPISELIYGQSSRSIPIGVWINTGSYLGTKTNPKPKSELGTFI